jgi:hypothetical protein
MAGAPRVPGAQGLGEHLKGRIDFLIVDRMNDHYADEIYRLYGLEDGPTDAFFRRITRSLSATCSESGIEFRGVL